MTIEMNNIPAGTPSRPSAAPSGTSQGGSAPAAPAQEAAPAPPAHEGGGGKWVAVMSPETTSVVIALVSRHGVLATVPTNLPNSVKQSIPKFDTLS